MATATNSTIQATSEIRKLNFMTDHGSSRATTRLARRGCAADCLGLAVPVGPLLLPPGRVPQRGVGERPVGERGAPRPPEHAAGVVAEDAPRSAEGVLVGGVERAPAGP